MSWRSITVAGVPYRWKMGREFVTVQNSDGRRIALEHASSVTGIDDWDRACWKRYATVTPAHIEWLIQRSI